MGNSQSLSSYRYHFDDPKIGDLDLSYVEVYRIDDAISAEAARNFLKNKRILYVDCEGRCFGSSNQKLGTVQVATGLDCCLVFHITKYRESLNLLKNLFESDYVQKVFHDCSGDSAVLLHENNIRLKNSSVDDTQIAHKVIQSSTYGNPIDKTTGLSLSDLYKIYCGKNIPGNKRFNKNTSAAFGGNMWTDNRELTSGMIKYAVVDALAICEVFTKQKTMLRKNPQYKELIKWQLEKKIKEFDREQIPQLATSSGLSNWGLLAGAGAVAVLALGAAAVAGADKNEKQKRDPLQRRKEYEEQKKDECIIS